MTNKKNQLKRNERERKRVHQVNDGFDLLRTRLRKNATASKKLSKADTLREAVKYIQHLQQILESSGANGCNSMDHTIPATSDTFYPVKNEFDAYFPNPMLQDYAVSGSGATAPVQYASPTSCTTTSSNCSYSPQQMYYASPRDVFHNAHQHSP